MFLDAITFDAFISLKMCYHNASTMHQQCVNNVSIRYNIETIKVLLGPGQFSGATSLLGPGLKVLAYRAVMHSSLISPDQDLKGTLDPVHRVEG